MLRAVWLATHFAGVSYQVFGVFRKNRNNLLVWNKEGLTS